MAKQRERRFDHPPLPNGVVRAVERKAMPKRQRQRPGRTNTPSNAS